MNFTKMRFIQEGNEIIVGFPISPRVSQFIATPHPQRSPTLGSPSHLMESPHLPPHLSGPRAACVVPAQRMGHSVSMCTRLLPGGCATLRGTGLQRRQWVRTIAFSFNPLWLVRMGVEVEGGEVGYTCV